MANVGASGKKFKYPLIKKTHLVVGLCLVGVITLVIAAGLYYFRMYSDPDRTFWATIDNNLATSGVTKQINQTGTSGTTSDLTQLVFNSMPYVNYEKKITDQSTQPSSHLTLEGIGTLTADYNRYTYIDHAGRSVNYSNIYSMWLKSDQPQLFSSAVLGRCCLAIYLKVKGPILRL